MFSKPASRLGRLFTPVVKSRGQGYYAHGRARIVSATPDSIHAVVIGSEAYDSKFEWENGQVRLHCTCPYFKTDGPCKHLWAAAIAAEAHGYFSGLRAMENISSETELEAMESQSASPPKPERIPRWQAHIASIGQENSVRPRVEWPARRQILYVVELAASAAARHPVLSLCTRDRRANGTFGRIHPLHLEVAEIPSLPLAEDREILSAIAGGTRYYGYTGSSGEVLAGSTVIRHPLSRAVIPLAARTGRLALRRTTGANDLESLAWDELPWHFRLDLRPQKRGVRTLWLVAGILRRDSAEREAETMDITMPALITQGGYVFATGKVSPLAEDTSFNWLLHLRKNGSIEVPTEDRDDLLSTLLVTPALPQLQVPDELSYEEVALKPRPYLRIRTPEGNTNGEGKLIADLAFDYGGRLISAREHSRGFYDAEARKFVRRDPAAEQTAVALLNETGAREAAADSEQTSSRWELASSRLSHVIRTLLLAEWQLDADGKIFRRPGAFRMDVSSGVDWFELRGAVEYGETSAQLPELLEAVRRGEDMVRLSDGTFGFLPDAWLRRIGMFAGMGSPTDGHIRFRRTQAGLLDAMLACESDARCDEVFAAIRHDLQRFQRIDALPQPLGFVGHLRDYQREGVGWMEFLRHFSFGGCLADDMGVGKTAQVLAMLESRRELRGKGEGDSAGPSLVVVPRSLLFNWMQEAERFTPSLRVLNYTGLNRERAELAEFDLVLTTYGTLRRDAPLLQNFEFDYVILDEAQAVKNAGTEAAKAVRLLRARYRLALSGTPVENHIGELWSLFEFLNPGMLGSASVFRIATGAGKTMDEDTRILLGQALRPFILRRTKDQVARELPAKTEQTIYCELEPKQRKLYDELRRHYRDSLLRKIDSQGLGKSKIMVLEALLRLRQAACHPGLIDVNRSGEPSAKLEALFDQLREVIESGHKALVFSQFTSLLKIVRDQLDSEGIPYEYLDGKTRNRQACVERFQNDSDCKLFLISLKAGGLGLNLTAAEYVFLLDPWWNPAVEAQAIDRAHRIGQTKPVFAYRLIARDTVEEKVLELQKTKRDLAAAIIGQDNALIRDLRREDLELLLS